MPKLIIVSRSGAESEIAATSGLTLMENIRDAGFGDRFAICGGSCSCATCHVIVDEAWTARVGGAHEDESDLLDGSEHRTASSRLSCQIEVTDALNGLRVTIAPPE